MKRLFDIIFAIFLLLLLFVPMLIVGLIVKVSSPGPILYWSKRVGKNSELFWMPKFRSMVAGTPTVASHLLTEVSTHLTPIGSFLRKSSLDELPQLWCILNGSMSFIGPRPALFNQDYLIALRAKFGVDQLRPGVTGWAQVNGRDHLSTEEKIKFDTEYLREASLGLELKIFWLTLIKVVRQDGVSH
jgi:O-antigen biosynthesis protein WbqP